MSAIGCDCLSFTNLNVRNSTYNLTVIIITLILNIIAFGTVSSLLGFHIYLKFNNMTSLEYLRAVEEKEKDK